MAKKPSLRNNRSRPPDELNITPLIDMVVCLMFFLMMFASLLPVAIIDAPLPKIAETASEVKQAKDTKNKLEVMLYIAANGFTVKSDFGADRTFPLLADGKFQYDELHKYLVQLKVKKPNVGELTLMPSDDVPYDVIIQAMDAARELMTGDTGFQPLSPEIANRPEKEQFNRLFPDVSIGGV